MTDAQLKASQQAREDVLLSDEIDRRLEILFSAKTVGPDARAHLRGILKHYAKEPHPFRACVKDNMKRFGPGRTEAVCATLKDIIKGTTRWRGHEDGIMASAPEIDADTAMVILSLTDDEIDAMEMIVMEVRS